MTSQPKVIAENILVKLSRKLLRLTKLVFHFSVRAATKPRYILLCLWAFKELWSVDKQLKKLTLLALKDNPKRKQPELVDPKLKAEIRKRAIAIYWTARIHPLKTKCLHRSIVLHQWLQNQNIQPTLEIGWGAETGIGHAWLTYNGMVLNDRSDVAKHNARLARANPTRA